jgi:AraC family transcriptional activator of pobA
MARFYYLQVTFFSKTEGDTRFLRSSLLFNDLYAISTTEIKELLSLFTIFFKLLEREPNHKIDHYQSDIVGLP